jgi:hypothetical protein
MANTNLSIFAFNNKSIRFEKRDGQIWVSLTDMAKANGKLAADYMRLSSTTEFLTELESVMGIPITETIQGGIPEKQGTWGVEEVAIDFAQWCSVGFRIWVNRTIKELMVNTPAAPPPAPLPPADVRVSNLVSALDRLGVDLSNPRFNQHLKDLSLDILMAQKTLPGTSDRWLEVAEKAEEMGYPVALVTRFRSALGLWVSKHIGETDGLERKTEKRLCNGTQREIFLYRDSEVLEEIIREYMDVKALKS